MSNFLNSHDWRENIACPLSQTDLDKWQSELDAIAGVEDDGTKRWRFIWAQSPDAVIWDRYRREWRPRYPAGSKVDYVANPATGVLELKRTWYGVPRLFAEALLPRVHRKEQTERAGVDPDGDVFTERRVVGPEYVTMFCVTQHNLKLKDGWRTCCLLRLKKKQTCYGRYRPPDRHDIETLREDYHERVISKMCRPDEIPSKADKSFFYHAWMLNHLRDEKSRKDELADRRRETMTTIQKMDGTSWQSQKNRYSIPSGENNGNNSTGLRRRA